MQLLSTHADRQGVDISVAVCVFLFVCLFVRSWISPKRIKLAASNFARRFIGFRGRECPILGNFAPPEAQNRTNQLGRIARAMAAQRQNMCAGQPWRGRQERAYGPRVGSACVWIYGRPRRQMYLFFYSILAQGWNSDRPC